MHKRELKGYFPLGYIEYITLGYIRFMWTIEESILRSVMMIPNLLRNVKRTARVRTRKLLTPFHHDAPKPSCIRNAKRTAWLHKRELKEYFTLGYIGYFTLGYIGYITVGYTGYFTVGYIGYFTLGDIRFMWTKENPRWLEWK